MTLHAYVIETQEALVIHKSRCHDLGLAIRPQLFGEEPVSTAAIMDVSSPSSALSSAGESPKTTPTDIKYLRSQGGIKGVLEVHKAGIVRGKRTKYIHIVWQVRDEQLQGYVHLWKTTEIWTLLKRQQAFHNWFSKLRPSWNMCSDLNSSFLPPGPGVINPGSHWRKLTSWSYLFILYGSKNIAVGVRLWHPIVYA